MTKFEEEFKALTSWDWINIDLIQQILTRFGNWHSDEEFQKLFDKYSNLNDNYEKEVIRSSKLESLIADVVNLSEGWVSPEEHQARVNELIEAKEKKIKQLRKINHLYKKSKENAERLAVDRGERLNQAQDELASLESQLQQQALPVVPECVAEFIDESKGNLSLYGALFFICDNTNKELNNWVFREANQNLFARAWLDGYTIEKPQLFYLKNKLTNSYLCQYPSDKSFYHIVVDDDGVSKLVTKFTQQEIGSMETGSYEQIEVAE